MLPLEHPCIKHAFDPSFANTARATSSMNTETDSTPKNSITCFSTGVAMIREHVRQLEETRETAFKYHRYLVSESLPVSVWSSSLPPDSYGHAVYKVWYDSQSTGSIGSNLLELIQDLNKQIQVALFELAKVEATSECTGES